MVNTNNWNEYELVEKPILAQLEDMGYSCYDLMEADEDTLPVRTSLHEPVLVENLKESIKRLNPWISENNLNKAVREITKVEATDTMQANFQIHTKLVKGISLNQDLGKGKKGQTVNFIDFDNPDNNEFMAINQYKVAGPHHNIKPDIVIFINGIPVGVIECKNPTSFNEPEDAENEAIEQLRRYQNMRNPEIREGAEQLFNTNQVLVASWKDSSSYCTINAPARQYRQWKDPYPLTKVELAEKLGKEKVNNQDILIYSIFNKEHLLDLIRNFIVFEKEGQGMVKKLARYQQFRAVQKAMKQIKTAKRLTDRDGVVWHTQGSGKSLTMVFLGMKLKRELDNPTLLIVTDRKDLDSQIAGTFKSCGFPNPDRAESVKDLKEKLKVGTGQTIMTTVHKFQENEKEKYPRLNDDSNIFVMVDEAHRTQYKDLAANMRDALPNACYLGFTGTPIEKNKKSTSRTFGDYIDTYTIEQAVADGATLPIFYEGRMPELWIEGEDLDELFDRYFKDYSDEDKNQIKQKYATERIIAESRQRIKKVCFDIIKHYESKIDPLKAQIVAVSREAAVIYKEVLEELNGPESAVIFSGNNNDHPRLKKWHTSDEEQKDLIERFKKPKEEDSLSILIVCSMLLTGFDAPVEQVMYLDKPLKEHTLLQAIARTNRRYTDKNFGLIVDYYGISNHLKEALSVFNPKDVQGALTPIKNEVARLASRHRRAMKFFDGVDKDNLDACISVLEPENIRSDFKSAFRSFAKSMDIVMPDPAANPYRNDFKFLGKVYRGAKSRYRDKTINLKDCGEKVRKLIDEHIRASGIKILNEPVSILNKKEFEESINEIEGDEAKASEAEHAIRHQIDVNLEENPEFYLSLRERLEELIEKYRQGRLDLTEKIKEQNKMMDEIRNLGSKARRLGLTEREYAFYELLKVELQEVKEQVDKIAEKKSNYDTGNDSEPKVNHKIKELTEKLLNRLEDLAVIKWQQRDNVLREMRATIKKTLIREKSFRAKKEHITTRIMKLAKKRL
jgi:type I restriction enzyme R subunit